MNSAPQSSLAAAACRSGEGMAPFIQKTYDMVDDPTTDEIVSWSSDNKSFIIWNPPEFSRILLPTYFKHNNLSSFIRQLNTYGFRKVDPERWEFANEEFIKDQKHLLKNIHRKKTIQGHSHPSGSAVDPERAALEQEIEKLYLEKNALQSKLLSYNYLETEKLQLENFQRRLDGMEKRQTNLQNFFQKTLQNSFIVEFLSRKIESMDVVDHNKKRRLSQVDHMHSVAEGSLVAEGDYLANEDINLAPTKAASGDVQVEAAARHGVNDVFWEQFLTESPCCSADEEAISN